MHGRKALITGASSGIGAATARLLSQAGALVFLTGRTEAKLIRVQKEIEDSGAKVAILAADLCDPDAPASIVERAAAELGGLDLLVNNAGIYRPGRVAELAVSDWRMQFDLNLYAPFLLCKAAYPWLKVSQDAVVVNVLSSLAHRPVPGVGAYCASKAALLSLGQTLALEWASDGIRVVSVSPGVVETPIHGGADLSSAAAMHPLGRVGTAQEVAAAILFLAAEESGWTTGTDLTVDGGIHLA